MNLWETIFLFFAFLSFLLSALFLFKKRGNAIPNRILSVFLILFGFNLIYNVLYWSKLLYTSDYIHLFGVLAPIWVSYPPLMFLYVRSFSNHNKLSLRDIIHSLPMLLITFSFSRFYVLDKQEKLDVLISRQLLEYLYLGNFLHVATALVMIFYIILIYSSYKKSVNLNANKRRWLKFVIASFSCYILSMLIYFIGAHLGLISTEHDYFIMFAIVFFIGLVTYFGFMQPEIFNGLSVDNILPFKKYKKTGLSENASLKLKDQLLALMEKEKPYLDSELRLDHLANKLNISKHHMSQIINEQFEGSFFFFINSYRIKEAKSLLVENDELSISEIIYSCGFNNRVSFYKAFNKHTGMTPSDFKQPKG